MIVFLESNKKEFTTYLNPPIWASKLRLISCSLYNSWYNFIRGKVIHNNASKYLPDSHYTPITLAKKLAKYDYTLTKGLPHEITLRYTRSSSSVNVAGDNPLVSLLGLKTTTLVKDKAYAVNWEVPRSYEVYCDLVHSHGPIHLIAKFSPKGNPFDLLEYAPIDLTYELEKNLVGSISINIKVDKKVVNFNGRKINLVLELT